MVDYSLDYYTIIPHYTNGEYCIGPNIDSNKNAYGCNIDKCFEDDECNQAFEFPEGAIQYTTIVHLDIQTLTFTPSTAFSNSNAFTNSIEFSNSNAFTNSIEFSQTSDFSESKKFTKSSIFSLSNCYSSTDSSNTPRNTNNNKITFFQSMIESFVNVKTVTFTQFYSLLITLYDCSNELGELTFCQAQSYIQCNIPYIIFSFSRTYIATHFSIEIKINKISQEQLIGIVCGVVAAVFTIIGIVIIAFQHKYTSKHLSEFDDITSSENENIETEGETNTFDNIPTNLNNEFDNWL